jgi:hypothetical protein
MDGLQQWPRPNADIYMSSPNKRTSPKKTEAEIEQAAERSQLASITRVGKAPSSLRPSSSISRQSWRCMGRTSHRTAERQQVDAPKDPSNRTSDRPDPSSKKPITNAVIASGRQPPDPLTTGAAMRATIFEQTYVIKHRSRKDAANSIGTPSFIKSHTRIQYFFKRP